MAQQDLFDMQQGNYVTGCRSTKPMDRIQELIEAEQRKAFLGGAKNVARGVREGSLKLLLANVDNHGLGDFEFREIVKGVFAQMDKELLVILEKK